ncbi:hypothetical protein GLOIN_2v1488768 [Rhizophagus irregularis DAOM 181602=DAOM 197198]|nr:hypothetical protein GLOIN_2v1488768 [Rhizophagus irregularis DAOM 181602=DAOM 197198]
MSKSQFPRSLFPQFTEEELQKASKISHSSVNWTEYNKWVKAGEPFKEHDELMSMNQKLKNGSTQRRLAGTKQYNIIRTRKQRNGISSNKNDGKANQKAQTTTCDESKYCCKSSGFNQISNISNIHESDTSGSTKRRPNIGFYNVVPKESYIYTLTLTNNHFLMLRHLEERWFRCLAYLINHDSYLEFLNIFFTNKTTP